MVASIVHHNDAVVGNVCQKLVEPLFKMLRIHRVMVITAFPICPGGQKSVFDESRVAPCVNHYQPFPLSYDVFLAAHLAVVQPGLLVDVILVIPGFIQVHNDTMWFGVADLAYLSQVARSS